MTIVTAALALSLVFLAAGGLKVARDFDDLAPYLILLILPGMAGLALAGVALGVAHWTAWGWERVPAWLSVAATVSMVAYAGVATLLSRLFG